MTRRTKTVLYWTAGIAISLAGVATVRLVAPQYAGRPAAILGAIGHLVALAGLLVIAIGVRQRVWENHAAPHPAARPARTDQPDQTAQTAPPDPSDSRPSA
jgi:hypothetical protein